MSHPFLSKVFNKRVRKWRVNHSKHKQVSQGKLNNRGIPGFSLLGEKFQSQFGWSLGFFWVFLFSLHKTTEVLLFRFVSFFFFAYKDVNELKRRKIVTIIIIIITIKRMISI